MSTTNSLPDASAPTTASAGNDGDAPTAAANPGGFTEGSVGRHLVRLGAYMAMGSLSMNIAQLAEAVYLGIVGTEALAAMGFAFPITMVLFAFAGGVGTGASSVIARAMGEGDRVAAARLVTHAQFLGFGVGVLLSFVGFAFAEQVLAALGAQGLVLEMATDYLRVYMLGFPLFMLSMVGSTLLRATGNAASPGIIMTVGSVLQIALGPVLIFGWFGVSEMGIAGAAWAYVISRAIAAALYVALLIRVKMFFWSLVGMFRSWWSILHVGGPAVASGLIMPVSMLVVTRLLSGHGHEVVAGYNVAVRIETMAHMILWSASASVEPVIGQNWGAQKVDRVRRALWLGVRFSHTWAVVTFVFMVLAGAAITRTIDANETVVAVTQTFFWIIPLSIGFMGMMQMAISSFNARGLPGPPLVISIVRTFVLYIPLCYYGDRWFGYEGIFWATAATNVLGGLVAWWWNLRSLNVGEALLQARS